MLVGVLKHLTFWLPFNNIVKFQDVLLVWPQYLHWWEGMGGAAQLTAEQIHPPWQGAHNHTVETIGHVQSRDHPQVPSAVTHHHNRSTGPGHSYLKQTSHDCGSRYTNNATDTLTVAPTIWGLTQHSILRCKVHILKCRKWNFDNSNHYVTPNFKEQLTVNTVLHKTVNTIYKYTFTLMQDDNFPLNVTFMYVRLS